MKIKLIKNILYDIRCAALTAFPVVLAGVAGAIILIMLLGGLP